MALNILKKKNYVKIIINIVLQCKKRCRHIVLKQEETMKQWEEKNLNSDCLERMEIFNGIIYKAIKNKLKT